MRIEAFGTVLLFASSLVSCHTAPPRVGSSPAEPRVVVDAGALAGRVDSSGLIVFRGIPYAAPPVGNLRWRPPQPLAHWAGVRPAQMLGHNCMQLQPYGDIDPFTAGISEDCLYLNVTTQSTSGRRPVMVWIHGGGFFAGFGGEERHDGSVLARKGVVVVTINYRLGPFGFLAHPALTREAPTHSSGDYGLLDQIAALQWVQRNIDRFGGDPARVTIFGESAGSMSVSALIGSPLAKGLFRGAIMESGVASGPFAFRLDSAEALGVRIVAVLGVTGADATADRLRALNADSLLAATARVAGNPGRPILFPVIDGNVVPQPVDSALLRGEGNVVPVIVGSNADEPQSVFGAPSRAMARLMTARGGAAWLYQFTRVGEDSASRAQGAREPVSIRERPILERRGLLSVRVRIDRHDIIGLPAGRLARGSTARRHRVRGPRTHRRSVSGRNAVRGYGNGSRAKIYRKRSASASGKRKKIAKHTRRASSTRQRCSARRSAAVENVRARRPGGDVARRPWKTSAQEPPGGDDGAPAVENVCARTTRRGHRSRPWKTSAPEPSGGDVERRQWTSTRETGHRIRRSLLSCRLQEVSIHLPKGRTPACLLPRSIAE